MALGGSQLIAGLEAWSLVPFFAGVLATAAGVVLAIRELAVARPGQGGAEDAADAVRGCHEFSPLPGTPGRGVLSCSSPLPGTPGRGVGGEGSCRR